MPLCYTLAPCLSATLLLLASLPHTSSLSLRLAQGELLQLAPLRPPTQPGPPHRHPQCSVVPKLSPPPWAVPAQAGPPHRHPPTESPPPAEHGDLHGHSVPASASAHGCVVLVRLIACTVIARPQRARLGRERQKEARSIPSASHSLPGACCAARSARRTGLRTQKCVPQHVFHCVAQRAGFLSRSTQCTTHRTHDADGA